MRGLLRVIVAYGLFKTGYRFSKNFRHEVTLWHKFVYRLIGTPRTNILADEMERSGKIYGDKYTPSGDL